MNTFQHFDSCPLQNSNCGRGGIFYHFMAANTLATQIFSAATEWTVFYYFYNLLSWDKSGAVRVKYEAWDGRRWVSTEQANCWIMLALEGQGCSYSALGCGHQEHTKRRRESNNKIEPIKYSQLKVLQKNIFHLRVKSWSFENISIFIRHLNWRVAQCQGSIYFCGNNNFCNICLNFEFVRKNKEMNFITDMETAGNYPQILKFKISCHHLH